MDLLSLLSRDATLAFVLLTFLIFVLHPEGFTWTALKVVVQWLSFIIYVAMELPLLIRRYRFTSLLLAISIMATLAFRKVKAAQRASSSPSRNVHGKKGKKRRSGARRGQAGQDGGGGRRSNGKSVSRELLGRGLLGMADDGDDDADSVLHEDRSVHSVDQDNGSFLDAADQRFREADQGSVTSDSSSSGVSAGGQLGVMTGETCASTTAGKRGHDEKRPAAAMSPETIGVGPVAASSSSSKGASKGKKKGDQSQQPAAAVVAAVQQQLELQAAQLQQQGSTASSDGWRVVGAQNGGGVSGKKGGQQGVKAGRQSNGEHCKPAHHQQQQSCSQVKRRLSTAMPAPISVGSSPASSPSPGALSPVFTPQRSPALARSGPSPLQQHKQQQQQPATSFLAAAASSAFTTQHYQQPPTSMMATPPVYPYSGGQGAELQAASRPRYYYCGTSTAAPGPAGLSVVSTPSAIGGPQGISPSLAPTPASSPSLYYSSSLPPTVSPAPGTPIPLKGGLFSQSPQQQAQQAMGGGAAAYNRALHRQISPLSLDSPSMSTSGSTLQQQQQRGAPYMQQPLATPVIQQQPAGAVTTHHTYYQYTTPPPQHGSSGASAVVQPQHHKGRPLPIGPGVSSSSSSRQVGSSGKGAVGAGAPATRGQGGASAVSSPSPSPTPSCGQQHAAVAMAAGSGGKAEVAGSALDSNRLPVPALPRDTSLERLEMNMEAIADQIKNILNDTDGE